MKIEVLGVGCAKCDKLYEQTARALADSGHQAELTKVDRLDEIVRHGVMMTPALVIDGEVKCTGSVPKPKKIAAWIDEAAARNAAQ